MEIMIFKRAIESGTSKSARLSTPAQAVIEKVWLNFQDIILTISGRDCCMESDWDSIGSALRFVNEFGQSTLSEADLLYNSKPRQLSYF